MLSYQEFSQPPRGGRGPPSVSESGRGPPSYAGSDKRRSWADMVAGSEDASTTISEISFGPSQGDVGQMGQRRRSWLNLMESDENLTKVNQNPTGAPMKIISLNDKKGKKGSLNDSTSKASTASEFVLVPKEFTSNSRIATTEIRPNYSLNSQTPKENLVYRWSKKRCLCCAAIFIVLVIIAIIVGLSLKSITQSQSVYELKLRPPSYVLSDFQQGSTQTLRATFRSDNLVVFDIMDGQPVPQVKTVIDFNTVKAVSVDNIADSFCYVTYLDHSLTEETLEKAVKNLQKWEFEPSSGWEEDWDFVPEEVPSSLRDQTISPDINICNGRNTKLLLLKRSHRNGDKKEQCSGCYKFCVPEYGIIRDETTGNDMLNVLKQYCFWQKVEKWSEAYGDSDQHIRSTTQSGANWVKPKFNPQNDINAINEINQPVPGDVFHNIVNVVPMHTQPPVPATVRNSFTERTIRPVDINDKGWVRVNINGQQNA